MSSSAQSSAINLINSLDLNNYLTELVFPNSADNPITVNQMKDIVFVKENLDVVIKSMVLQWMKHRIRAEMLKQTDAPYLKKIDPTTQNLPAWTQNVFNQGKSIYRFDADCVTRILRGNLVECRDYLYAAAKKYIERQIQKTETHQKNFNIRLDLLKTDTIKYGSIESVLTAAQNANKLAAKEAEKRIATLKTFKQSQTGTKKIMDLDNDFSVVQLLSHNALTFESDYMGHCIGNGYYDESVLNNSIQIYSIRDKNGIPHVTFEVSQGNIIQCKGKGNSKPAQRYRQAILSFIEKQKLNIENDQQNICAVWHNDKLYDLYHLPPHFIIKEDLVFYGKDVDDLPNLSDAIVEGNFTCRDTGLTTLKGAPKRVTGSFDCSENSLLQTLQYAPEYVGEDFICSNCSQLETLHHSPQYIGKDFDCSNCPHLQTLEGAPQKINGKFNCSNCRLISLKGAPRYVEGSFICFHNHCLRTLEGAPVEVGKKFDCSMCGIISLKGAPKRVKGSFLCFNNHFLRSLSGAPVQVGKDFDCSICRIKSLKGAPQYVYGSFICAGNKLQTLNGIPFHIGRHIDCSYNNLISLKGLPEIVHGDLRCIGNNLKHVTNVPKCIEGHFNISENPFVAIENMPEQVMGDIVMQCTLFYYDKETKQILSIYELPENTTIEGDLRLSRCNLDILPDLSTITVTGTFACDGNKLISLVGAPRSVGKDLICKKNKLKSLEGCPQYIGGSFDCSSNKSLHSLEGCPTQINGDFTCNNCGMTSLVNGPETINGNFVFAGNNVKTTRGCPKSVNGIFDCSKNPLLHNFEFLPTGMTQFCCEETALNQSSVLHPNIIKCLDRTELIDISYEQLIQNYYNQQNALTVKTREKQFRLKE